MISLNEIIFQNNLNLDVKKLETNFNPERVKRLISENIDPNEKNHNKKCDYYNVACAFDIETTSTEINGEKVGFMYIWQFSFNGCIIMGRTWDDFTTLLTILQEELSLSLDQRLIVWVHNLSFEFQFIRKLLEWEDVFALDNREPVRATTTNGIEFRCSYILSGLSLDGVARSLIRYDIKKLKGSLDYTRVRTYKTELTEEELRYCVNDVQILCAYIYEKADCGNISDILMTKTSYVRSHCRHECMRDKAYIWLMNRMKITDESEYDALKRAFQGGFTHANPFNAFKTLTDVASYDITSSYPAVMLAEKYPMGTGKRAKIRSEEELNYYLKNYCCVFTVLLKGLTSVHKWDSYLSYSKCYNKEGGTLRGTDCICYNGRIVSATELTTTITNVDWEIIKEVYAFDSYRIGEFIYYKKGYLPKKIIQCVLDFYEGKTTLKGVEGKEREYQYLKEMLNSLYGMTVTDIIRPNYSYKFDSWYCEQADKAEALQKYNSGKSRFLFYPWGVFVTAYARRNLWWAIIETGADHVYSDTDSEKFTNYKQHKEYFEKYNKWIIKRISDTLEFYGIDTRRASPMNKKGESCPIGVWSFEGIYNRFKTIGAKRYMTYKGGELSLTISGVNKFTGVPWLARNYAKNPTITQMEDGSSKVKLDVEDVERIFKIFDEGFYIPGEGTGKLTHTYIDDAKEFYIEDYKGDIAHIKELSSVHLGKADYSINTLSVLDEILNEIKEL